MIIIAGLGNPGAKYEKNRHNIGFMVVEALATRWKASFTSRKFDGELAQASFGGEKVLLLNRCTEVINFWQDENKHSAAEAAAKFPDCKFQG